MCIPFSCIVDRKGNVYYDNYKHNHSELMEKHGKTRFSTNKPEIETEVARVEIITKDGTLDNWKFIVDEHCKPTWFSPAHEAACWTAHKIWVKWLKEQIEKAGMVQFKKYKPPHLKKLSAQDVTPKLKECITKYVKKYYRILSYSRIKNNRYCKSKKLSKLLFRIGPRTYCSPEYQEECDTLKKIYYGLYHKGITLCVDRYLHLSRDEVWFTAYNCFGDVLYRNKKGIIIPK